MDGTERDSMSHWAILGCGYVGRRLASRLLEKGHAVTVTSRTREGQSALAEALPGALALTYCVGERLESCSEYDVVVISAPPDATAPSAERALAEQLATRQRLVYLSTTGVYAPANGSEVGDAFEVAPGSERSDRRLQVEEALQESHPGAIALRIAAIYGPGRGVHERLRRNTYRLIGEANTMVSRIYVDDLVSAIVLLGETPSLAHRHYVIGDEGPSTATEHAREIAEYLGLPFPPRVALEDVSPAVRAMLGADRKIVPTRLHSLGWRARFPTWREGLAKALEEESENNS